MKKFSGYLILIPSLLGVLALLGWLLDIEPLKRPYEGASAVNPTAAASILLGSVAFYLKFKAPYSKLNTLAATILSAAIFLVGLLTLLPSIGIDMHVDSALFYNKIMAERALGKINSLPPNGGISLLLGACALSFAMHEKAKWKKASNYFALSIFTIGTFSSISHLFRVKALGGILAYIPMSVPASISCIALSLAILFEQEDFGFMKVISSKNTGGKIARRLLPTLFIVPITLGYLRLWALTWQSQQPVELGVAALVSSIVIFLLLIVWNLAKAANGADEKRKQAEIRLEQEAQLFNLTPDAILYGQMDFTISHINDSALKMFDLTEEQAVGRKIDDILKFEIVDTSREEVRKVLWGQAGQWRGEMIFTTNAGKKINVLATLKATKNEAGENSGWISIYSNINKLKETQQRLEFALDGMAAGLWEWNTKEPDSGWLSSKYNQLLGYNPNELPATINSFKSLLNPNEADTILTFFRQRASINESFETELQYKTKSGKYRWFSVTGKPQFDRDGSPSKIIGSIIDIDEKKKAQHIVQQQAALIRMMPDGVVYATMDNIILNMNTGAESLFETALPDALGKKIDELASFNIMGKTREAARAELSATGFLRSEIELTSKSGKKNNVLATVKKFENIFDSEPGWICVYTDIGPLRLNDELKAANNYLRQLAYIGQHDLKAPIRALQGLTALLLKSPNLKEEEREILYHQQNSVRQMQITNDGLNEILLLRERILQKDNTEVEFVTLNALIENVLTPFKSEPELNGAEIILDINSVADVKLPQFYFRSIFYNLISNAFKYRDDNRSLKLLFSAKLIDADTLYISISDNGIGFDSRKNEDKIFQLFKRFHSDRDGAGLGLHIVKSIIDSYKGNITVTSEPHKGTCFEIHVNLSNLA
jgi:PAS domain S-box-containing protein